MLLSEVIFFTLPPSKPVKEKIVIPIAWATFIACTRFLELPEAEMTISRSPASPKSFNCFSKINSYSKSLEIAVITDRLSHKLIALTGLALAKDPTPRSAAKCEAVEALPPFPAM